MSNYKQEFPSYDGLLPLWMKGWEDVSWHNDACPSLRKIIQDEFGAVEARLWCEWIDVSQREIDGDRFTLHIQFVDPEDNSEQVPGTNTTHLTGETLEDLRAAAVKWWRDNVGDSILEGDFTTAEILENVATMWAFHNTKKEG